MSALQSGVSYRLFARFFPVGFFPIYAWVAWGGLSYTLIQSTDQLVAAGLWLILSIFLFHGWVVGYLPSYLPLDSAKQIDEAAYITAYRKAEQTVSEESPTPRIKQDHSNHPSDRYET